MSGRIDSLADIDLYDAEGVNTWLREACTIYKDLSREIEFGAEALRHALGTAGGVLGWADVEGRMRARRTTAPLRRVAEASQFSAIQIVKSGQLFKVNYSEGFERAGKKPAKTFTF
ncbi:hypothetical protein [Candidatus Frankia nodulisporulans]|uniref:hypothetical protein n=1 Tax=Candidatus Frankia nodulisporulans TaxID=2060052 RepID=UPI0013D793E5|nr:hypothetical protein [Candidatus Frankia nodulisporulans]